MQEALVPVRDVTLGGGAVLLLFVFLILKGYLYPREMYQRLVETLEKKDVQYDRLIASYEKMSDSYDRISRRMNNKVRE